MLTSPERALGSLCHHVRLIQNDELESLAEEHPRLRKSLDLLPHDVDATIIRCVELEDVRLVRFRAVNSACDGKDRGRFAGTRWSIEEQMRKAAFLDKVFD